MTDDAKTPPAGKSAAPKTTPKAAAPETTEDRYTHDELIAGGMALVGESPMAIAGGLAECSRKTLTVDQARDEARKYLRRKVGV